MSKNPSPFYLSSDKRKWYYHLISKENGLLKYENPTEQNIVICHNSGQNLYSLFQDTFEFEKYLYEIESQHRNYYEIILSNTIQFPRFDLDYPDETNEDYTDSKVNKLIEIVIQILEEKEIKLDLEKDLLIYSSHSQIKKSYHIKINNFVHKNQEEAKYFYDLIKSKLPSNFTGLDPKVYNSNQQFRIVHCQKSNSNRIKIFREQWNFNNYI